MAKTRKRRSLHHDRSVPKLTFWDQYQESLVFLSVAVILFGLVIYGGLGRSEKIIHLAQESQQALSEKDHQTSYQLLKDAIMLAPNNPSLHFQLSQLYKTTNNWEEAQKELLVALELSPNSTSIRSELEKVQTTMSEPGKVAEELNFWKREVESKPDYRDGWVQLAVRHFELYQNYEAKIALEKANSLDPNFETIKKLREIIK
jgi:tetratricopeptide (TPR) repeat protein